MKKVLGVLFVMVVLFFSTSINAQTIGKKYLEKIKAQVEEMATAMNLDDAQKTKVLELKKTSAINTTEVSKKFAKGTEELKAAKKEINSKFYAGVKEICTKEQMKLWGQYKKSKK